MKDDIGCAALFLAAVIACLIFYRAGKETGYKEACKDCAEGKLKYELKEMPGGERLWVKKGE